MTTEFPCIEATRCLVTEAEMGMRLSVKPSSKSSESGLVATFTQDNSLKEEWYLHFEVAGSGKKNEGSPRRCLQLRHSKTNLYLCTDDKGRISCTSIPSDSTWWLLQRVLTNNSLAPEQDGLSDVSKSESPSTDDQYILISRKYPQRRLCSAKAIEGSGEQFMLIASKNTATEPSIWTLKFTSGELCSIVNPVVHHHMRCNQYGKLSLSSESSAWEIFRFTEAGNGDLYISSWVHFTKFLASDSDGKVFLESKYPGTERWRLEAPPRGNGLYIRSVTTRRYLSVGRNRSEHLWTTTKPNDYALWHLDAPQLQKYYLTSLFASTKAPNETMDINQFYFKDCVDDVHVSSNKEGPFLSPMRESDEEWKVEVTPEGYFTFFSMSHEKYLGCNSKGDVHTTTSKGAWTLWRKKASRHGGVTFESTEHGRFLTVTKTNNTLETTKADEKTDLRHSWRIDPCIPRSVSGGSGGYISGAKLFNSREYMPFAVFGAIEAARTSKTSNTNDTAAQRPISSWKSWVKSDPKADFSLSPSYVILHSPSSINTTASNITRDANVEKKTNGTITHKPLKTNDEKKNADSTSDKLLVANDESNEEKKCANETSNEKDEPNSEKESAEVSSDEPSDENDEPNKEKESAEATSDEPPEANHEPNEEKESTEASPDELPKVNDGFNEEKKSAGATSDDPGDAFNENEGDII